jgi:hypothetical protein
MTGEMFYVWPIVGANGIQSGYQKELRLLRKQGIPYRFFIEDIRMFAKSEQEASTDLRATDRKHEDVELNTCLCHVV